MKRRLWALPVLVGCLVLAGSGAVFAMPSLGGPTGIVSLPTAEIAPEDELQTALSYQSLTVQGMGMYGTDEDITVWTVQVLGAISDRAELWAAYSTADNTVDGSGWGVGGKIQLTSEAQGDAASVALGVSMMNADVTFGLAERYLGGLGMYLPGMDLDTEADVWKAYLVATKELTQPNTASASTRVLGSVGLMHINGNVSGSAFTTTPSGWVSVAVDGEDSLTQPFVGLEFIGPQGTTLGLEYRWKDSDVDADAVMSAVLRHPFSPELTAEVGVTNADPFGFGMDDQNFFVRIGYDIAQSQPGW